MNVKQLWVFLERLLNLIWTKFCCSDMTSTGIRNNLEQQVGLISTSLVHAVSIMSTTFILQVQHHLNDSTEPFLTIPKHKLMFTSCNCSTETPRKFGLASLIIALSTNMDRFNIKIQSFLSPSGSHDPISLASLTHMVWLYNSLLVRVCRETPPV